MWGEPFDLYEDGNAADRLESLRCQGVTYGALIQYGTSGKEGLFVWERPEASAMVYSALDSTFGMVLAIDVSSDPSTDWLMLYLSAGHGDKNSTVIGWVPAPLVTVL